MSPLAYQILALFIDHVQRVHHGEYGRGYIASWTLGEMLGLSASSIDAVRVKIHPSNTHEKALKELVDHGIVEEVKDLGCRYRLVVKESEETR